MNALFVLFFAGLLVYLSICFVSGFKPPCALVDFMPDQSALERRFRQSTATVVDCYRMGIKITPGMQLAEESSTQMLVDLRPTSRILGGNFGLTIRLSYIQDGEVTKVLAEACKKVPFAWGMDHESAFRQAESVLRMNAKKNDLDEMITL